MARFLSPGCAHDVVFAFAAGSAPLAQRRDPPNNRARLRVVAKFMYRFISLGHSHIVAFAKAVYGYQASDLPAGSPPIEGRFIYLYDPAYTPNLVGLPDAPALNPKLHAQLAELAWSFVILVCGGNEHNVLGIVRNKRPFDFVLSSEPDLPLQPGHEFVPEGVIREVLKSHMEESLQTMRAFRAATQLPVLQLEPPPPLPRHRVLA